MSVLVFKAMKEIKLIKERLNALEALGEKDQEQLRAENRKTTETLEGEVQV